MAKAFDDEAAALSDIANSPDISAGELTADRGQIPPKLKSEGGNLPPSDDPEADKKIARVFSLSVKKAIKKLTGEEMERGSVDDLSEVAAMACECLRVLPRKFFIGAIVAAFLVPWAPYAYRVLTAEKKEGNNA